MKENDVFSEYYNVYRFDLVATGYYGTFRSKINFIIEICSGLMDIVVIHLILTHRKILIEIDLVFSVLFHFYFRAVFVKIVFFVNLFQCK